MLPHIPYNVTTTEKVLELEKDLKQELSELKNEIEENEMIHGITHSTSSVPLPKDISHFRQEREYVIKRAMEVCEARKLTLQADIMQEELSNCQQSDYTSESLPLLLHQHFTERVQQLVQCKHMHMVRWKRFCEHTSTLEAVYPCYQDRIALIMSEYNDCLERSQRLAIAREAFIAANNSAMSAVTMDDILIYFRWLVSHLHSLKTYQQFMRVLEWLPVSHKDQLTPALQSTADPQEDSPTVGIPSRYQDEGLPETKVKTVSSVPASATGQSETVARNPLMLSSNPLPASQEMYAAASEGGGLASDETGLNLPLHVSDMATLKPQVIQLSHMYAIELDLANISTAAKEMELYAAVCKKFKQVYNRQEHLKTFKVGQENWGADSSMHALKQEANWTAFISLKAEKCPDLEKKMVELRSRKNIDEVLSAQARFLHISDAEKVQDALRQHASVVHQPVLPQPVSVTANKTNYHTASIWKRIYTNPELYAKNEDKLDAALQEFEDRDCDNVDLSRAVAGKRRKDSYDYVSTVQLLGLDESEQDGGDPISVQAGYLSFLQLRHLRIRDLQRTCLSVLNYFRSIERTLTINDGGLSLESGALKKTSVQNHRQTTGDGTAGGGGGLGSHHYVHYTPADYKLEEMEFMQFSEVDNHDDYYSVDEGRVHVQDQRGYYVVYQPALDDLKQLEEDLLLIGSHYIQKDKELRTASGINRSAAAKKRQQMQSMGDFNICNYSHQELDRFGVLLDLWSNEAAFLECKRELLDCYMEAYQHVFDREEKRLLAQVITNIMGQRPRYDFTAANFVKSYRCECVCLRLKTQLVKSVLDKQIEEQREYIDRVQAKAGPGIYGIPHKIISKQPVSVNLSRSALKNVFMLEFHPSLAIASRIPDALSRTYQELQQLFKPQGKMEVIELEKRMLEVALQEWQSLEPMGTSYTLQTQRDLFSDVYVEDPVLMEEVCRTQLQELDQVASRKSQKDKQTSLLTTAGKVLQAVNLRHRLLDAAWECEILSKIYRHQSVQLGYDECHLFLRFVQFEFASFKEDAGRPPPVFITAIQEDDTAVDRYVPNHLYLAVHEIDESHVGRFSFRTRDGILQVLKSASLGSLEAILMCQVVHKNALICAVQQVAACQSVQTTDSAQTARPLSPVDTRSEKSCTTATTALSTTTQPTAMTSQLMAKAKSNLPEAFVSVQLEKGPSRDLMLNEFINKKAQMGTVLKNPEKMEELKRKLMKEYCEAFSNRIAQYSLRSQIIEYYNSILRKLHDMPTLRDTYFMLGEPHEKKTVDDDLAGLQVHPREMKQRPRRVLSPDGQHVLNLWFIPHQSEILMMHKTLDDASCKKALTYHLRLVSALHDILQYLCAFTELGGQQACADWGGTEGIGASLREIQKQVDHLQMATDPEEVCQLLALRRDVIFLHFDVAIRHSVRETFLATNNLPAYKAICECMHFALHNLSDAQHRSFAAVQLNVPEPLEASDPQARLLYPWRTFLNRHGPFPVHFWQWQLIEHNVQLCLAAIKDVDRHVVNGEILGVSLLMEDVLASGQTWHPDQQITTAPSDLACSSTDKSVSSSASLSSSLAATEPREPGDKGAPKHNLSRIVHPIEAYKLLKSFLLLWKRLEVMKAQWGQYRLGVQAIDTPTLYTHFCKEYKKDVLYPILQSVARRSGQADMYEGMVSDQQVLLLPKGATEVEIRSRQLQKLLESLECQMINEVHRKLSRELTLVLAERAREESALPTDLWKKPAMKEGFTINKPHIAEAFIKKLMSDVQETEEGVRVRADHLSACLNQLATQVMAREKHNYESYSMYYENLLRVHHQLLFQREQEIKALKDELKCARHSSLVEVQCQLADANQDLLLEITALRAKIAEMREQSLSQETSVRQRVQQEYDALIHSLFHCCFQIKKKFEEFRDDLHDDVYEKISEARREGIETMSKLKQRLGLGNNVEPSQHSLTQSGKLREIQQENYGMNILIKKMRAMSSWRSTHDRATLARMVTELRREADKHKKDYLNIKLFAEEETVLLRQQMVALRHALRASEKECHDIKQELDKELKVKKEKAHTSQQKAQSQRQLEEARRANVDKLLEELEEKDGKLRTLSDVQERNQRLQTVTADKAERDVQQMKRQLKHERSLKLDAFQRVDNLQTHVYDIETGLYAPRPQTAIGTMRVGRSRASSAGVRRPYSRGSTAGGGGGVWPPQVPWPANSCDSPAGELADINPNSATENKKIQRPKTTQGRLRSRIADQLLNELQAPDHHETLIKLREMQQQKQKVF